VTWMEHAMTGIKQLNWELSSQSNWQVLIASELEMMTSHSSEG